MCNSNLTIVIQGPLHELSLSSIETYLKFGKVIFSTWEEDIIDIDLSKYKRDNVKFIIKKLGMNVDEEDRELSRQFFNDRWARYRSVMLVNDDGSKQLDFQNISKQVNSTLNGLTETTTAYVLKLRSDASYDNLQPILDLINQYPNKIITGNVSAIGKSMLTGNIHRAFQISDHLIAGKTELITSMFNIAKQRLIAAQFEGDMERHDSDINGIYYHICPETLLGSSGILANGETIDISKHRELLDKYYRLISINELKPFTITITNSRWSSMPNGAAFCSTSHEDWIL